MTLSGVGQFCFRFRNLLVPVAFALVLAPGPRISSDPLLPIWIGILIALLGQCARALTIGLKYIVRGGRNQRVYADELVTEGIFAHTRNPMYLGNLLILAGIAIASNSWICVLLAISLTVYVYVAIVAAEEQFLRGNFGAAYDTYCAAVPRWSIRFSGLGNTLRGHRFHWRRLLVKEYGTTTAWILALSVTIWLSLNQAEDGRAEGGVEDVLLGCAVAAAVFWATVRWLKKTRSVVAD